MSTDSKRFSRDVEAGIAGHLRQIEQRFGGGDAERKGLLVDVEDQVREQLRSLGRAPSVADLNAALARMDPPEAYGVRVAERAAGRGARPLLTGAAVVLTILAAGLLYALVADRSPTSAPANPPAAPVVRTDVPAPEPRIAPPAEAPADAPSPAPAPALTVAVLDFSTSANIRDADAVRRVVADGLIDALAAHEGIRAVERAELEAALREQSLGAEGLVEASTASRLGRLLGARVIAAGSIVQLDDQLTLTARLIDAETGELSLVRESGARGALPGVVGRLSAGVLSRLTGAGAAFARHRDPAGEESAEAAAKSALRAKIAGRVLPRVLVMIPETHLGRRLPDPAGETELVAWLTDCGFPVASPEYEGVKPAGAAHEMTDDAEIRFRRNRGWRTEDGAITLSRRQLRQCVTGGLGAEREKLARFADVVVLGEGLSERAAERGGLVSCKARVEIKAVDVRTGEVLLARSAYGAGVDAAEEIAGKRALQQAGGALARETIPTLVDRWGPRVGAP